MKKMKVMYICSVILFGTIGMFLRFTSLPSEASAFFRGLIGSMTIGLMYLLTHRKIDFAAVRKNGKVLVLSGVMLGLNWVLLFAAYKRISVGTASLCNYMAPVFVILLSPFLYKEKLDLRKSLCVLGAFAGIVLVSDLSSASHADPGGILLGLGAAAAFTGIVICNRELKDLPAFDRVFFQLGLSALVILVYVLITDHGVPLPQDMRSILITIMIGVVHTGIAYILYLIPMGSLPVHDVALLGYIEPVTAVICSAVFLKEPLSLTGYAGAVLVILSACAGELMNQE